MKLPWRGSDAHGGPVSAHQHAYFEGHAVRELNWPGPVRDRVPGFYVHEFGPGPRYEGWTYATVGVWDATQADGVGLEFLLSASHQTDRAVELLAMSAHYHAGPPSQRLDVGHTVPVGEPWLPGSACDHLLVSLPYPYGTELEHCAWPRGHARHVWLLPITAAERSYKATQGVEALEQALEAAGIIPTDPQRASVV